jgi:hypothetical protein
MSSTEKPELVCSDWQSFGGAVDGFVSGMKNILAGKLNRERLWFGISYGRA